MSSLPSLYQFFIARSDSSGQVNCLTTPLARAPNLKSYMHYALTCNPEFAVELWTVGVVSPLTEVQYDAPNQLLTFSNFKRTVIETATLDRFMSKATLCAYGVYTFIELHVIKDCDLRTASDL
jgi:hypothetical protein